MDKVIRAVTGKTALTVQKNGEVYDKQMSDLENEVTNCLEKTIVDHVELWDCLKAIKLAKAAHENELPLLTFRCHQQKLSELRAKLTKATNDFVQQGFVEVKNEMQGVLKDQKEKNFVVHKLSSLGDGKKIINYGLDCVQDRPAMFFAHDGHNSIICSCSVPVKCVNPSFSALLWLNPVAALLEGQTRATPKDPELHYSVISKRTDKIDEAIELAKNFMQSHL